MEDSKMHKSQVNWNPGTTKEALDEGYEIVPSGEDNEIFAYTKQNPNRQGWRDTPPELIPVIN